MTKIAVKVLHECNMITRMFLNIFGGGICVWIDKHELIGMIISYSWRDHPKQYISNMQCNHMGYLYYSNVSCKRCIQRQKVQLFCDLLPWQCMWEEIMVDAMTWSHLQHRVTPVTNFEESVVVEIVYHPIFKMPGLFLWRKIPWAHFTQHSLAEKMNCMVGRRLATKVIWTQGWMLFIAYNAAMESPRSATSSTLNS